MYPFTENTLKKALDTAQERTRTYINSADKTADHRLGKFLHTCAEIEGRHGEHLRGHLRKLENGGQ